MKYVDRFRNGVGRRIILLESLLNKAVQARSHEITNTPRTSQLRKQRQRSLNTDLKTNYDTETNTSDAGKIKNRRKQNFEDEANTQCNCIKRTLNEST